MRLAILLVLLLVSGCGAIYTPNPMHEGHIAVMADAKGMRSFMDGMNGFITNGKASPDQDTAHWIHRKAEEREHTTRATAPSFLDRMFQPSPSSNQGE